jgi:bacterioferritin-associated ferredoxin
MHSIGPRGRGSFRWYEGGSGRLRNEVESIPCPGGGSGSGWEFTRFWVESSGAEVVLSAPIHPLPPLTEQGDRTTILLLRLILNKHAQSSHRLRSRTMSLADSLNPPLTEGLDAHDEIVCRCLKVRLSTIATAIDVCGAATIRDLKCSTGAGDGCMSCHIRLRQLLQTRVETEVLNAVSR